MSSPSRVLAILGLFTPDQPIWTPDGINEKLGYSRPTGYRYVKELVDAGMLRKVAAGHYSLGGRIIELDFNLRQTDPVLLASVPVMNQLAASTGLDVVLTVLFAGPKVIDIHRVNTDLGIELTYGRGRPRPLFRSAAPKVLLAHLPRAQHLKLWGEHPEEIASAGLGRTASEFSAALARVRRRGYYRSAGEIEPTLGSLAVPVFDQENECVAALALLGALTRLEALDDSVLLLPLQTAAASIRETLAAVRGSARAI